MWYCKFGKPHSAPASINWNLNLLIDPQFSTAKTNDFAMTRGIFLWTWKSGFKHRRIIFQRPKARAHRWTHFWQNKVPTDKNNFFLYIFHIYTFAWVLGKGSKKWKFKMAFAMNWVWGSCVPLTYFEKWFFQKPFGIIPWMSKRVLHIVWALYYVYIVVEMTLNMAK